MPPVEGWEVPIYLSGIEAMLERQERIRKSTPEIEQAAQQMRRSMTRTEALLWQELRNKKLDGLRFRAQHAVGLFILDFYCPLLKLVIEVDGSSHRGNEWHHQSRDEHVKAFGYTVLRVTNDEVINSMPHVLQKIRTIASELATRA